jgi:tripartite-type tricarboxylate transporter receptor subunit TctC
VGGTVRPSADAAGKPAAAKGTSVIPPGCQAAACTLGFSPIGDTPAQFAAFLKAEGAKWADVIRAAGITLQ